MSLQTYINKRDFKKTSEPIPHRFVVQKHLATRLHYDFRLEVHGVLKSWAVPKGPSLNPDDKRLAMMTEDHPLDYRTFEGTIPKGNYGAGEVIVWDEGVYIVRSEAQGDMDDEIEKKIEKGHLSILLYGKKIKGEFTLVKNKNADDNSWFLIKKDDAYASTEDVTTLNNSVLSEKMLGDTKQEPIGFNMEKIEHAKKTEMPHGIKPMLATSIEEPFNNKDWLFEIKWDGYRAIAEIEESRVKIYSRNAKDFSRKYTAITEALKKVKHTCILDGEIAVLDDRGRAHFQSLQDYNERKRGRLVYIVFDLLYLDGYDLRAVPLIKRKEILKQILPHNEYLQYSDNIEEHGQQFFALAKQQGIEGIVAKEKKSPYKEHARTRLWLKLKTRYQQEAIICGYTEPRGGRKYFGALILGIYKDKKLTYVGHTGTGFDDQMLKTTKELLDKYTIDHSPFEAPPIPNAPVQWVKPKILCEVAFTQWTEEKVMRHPVFLGLREDKEPEEVNESNPSSTKNQKLKLTNLSKIYFPADNITKGDVIDYYESVAAMMLPHIKDRPQTLNRFPNGIDGKSFYQKDLLDHPSWVKTVPIYSESDDKQVHYFVCTDKEGLLYAANLGCIEINVWNSKIGHLENPDYLVIDLDPEDIGFEKVVDAALVLKKILDKANILSYPKTSGATGMHIYIPLGAQYSTEIVRKFAEILAHIVYDKAPSWTSIVRSPKRRQGQVYIDFLQNRSGQTMAAPYSIRPREGAPVSTPLTWEEVTPDLRPEHFTIKNIPKRIAKVGDVWKSLLTKNISIEKSIQNLNII